MTHPYTVTLSPTDTEAAFSRYDDTSDGNQHVMLLLEGVAAGQWRWVTGYVGGGTFLLDRPFDVEPDEHALLAVDVAKAQNIHFRVSAAPPSVLFQEAVL